MNVLGDLACGQPLEVRMLVRVVGSGDAFGSGGRFQTCLWIRAADHTLLVDCGATSLVAMRRLGIARALLA